MEKPRYVVKVTPSENCKTHWPCMCEYMGINGSYGSNLFPSVTRENLQKISFATISGAEKSYKRRIGRYYSMPVLEYVTWWKRVGKLPFKEKETELLKQYEKVKDCYEYRIMTVDEAWDDWTRLFKEEYPD